MSRFWRLTVTGAALLLALLLEAAPALAHAEFESASPGPGDQVADSPGVLVAVFSQELDASRSSLLVLDAGGNEVAEGGALGDDRHELRLELPELPPGEYEVRWTSFSAEDGELDRGTYTFTVLAGATRAPATEAPSAAPGPSDTPAGGELGVLLPIGAALLVAAAIALWLLRRQRA